MAKNMTTKNMRVEGYGIQKIPYMKTFKGKKVYPSIFKVRSDKKGNPVITLVLNVKEKGKFKTVRTKILRGE